MPITKEDALEHVGYEWRMYRTMGTLAKALDAVDDPVRDAILESLAVHARNLAEFFYEDGNGGAMRKALNIQPQKPPKEIGDFLEDANQYVNHMSPKRVSKKDWNYKPVAECFVKRLEELRVANQIPRHNWDGDNDELTKLICWDAVPNIPSLARRVVVTLAQGAKKLGIDGIQAPAGPTKYELLRGTIVATGARGPSTSTS